MVAAAGIRGADVAGEGAGQVAVLVGCVVDEHAEVVAELGVDVA